VARTCVGIALAVLHLAMKTPDLTVSDLMTTDLMTVDVNETLAEAHAEMELGVVRHLPVIDERKRLVGVISDRDLLGALASRKPRKVADVMTRHVVTTRPDASAATAVSKMLDYKIGSVLVVDDANTLVGMVTMTDYLEVARRALLGLPLER
jgi:CBS domain-containing protein